MSQEEIKVKIKDLPEKPLMPEQEEAVKGGVDTGNAFRVVFERGGSLAEMLQQTLQGWSEYAEVHVWSIGTRQGNGG
ncbi:MAG: hypothetical protein ACE5I9_05160 [Candidatus Methylomirabilales bacterium]